MALPPSSPRLPSPPPPTEIQIGTKSPSTGSSSTQEPTIEQNIIDANASRRIHPGTRAADMAAGPPLIALGEVCLQPHTLTPAVLIFLSLTPHFSFKSTSRHYTTITRSLQIATTSFPLLVRLLFSSPRSRKASTAPFGSMNCAAFS